MNDRVGSDNTVWFRLCTDHFELDSSHTCKFTQIIHDTSIHFATVLTSSNDERIILVDWAISLQEVRFQVNIEEISEMFEYVHESSPSIASRRFLPSQSFHGVIDRQYMNALSVLDIRARLNGDDVRKTNAQVVSDNAIHTNFLIGAAFIRKDDADSLFATLSFQQNSITSE
jgi:hypothetical protein